MRFSLFDIYGAKNSGPVFQAFAEGLDQLGLPYVRNQTNADVAVIWSVLWAGRMKHNRAIWDRFRSENKPVIVLEVGMLKRGMTWKIGVNGTNGSALWGSGIDPSRPNKLGIELAPWRNNGKNIVIALQREESHQWLGMPSTETWLKDTIVQIRYHTSKPIVIRPHPRQKISQVTQTMYHDPKKVPNTYDDYDFIDTLDDAWAVVNWNSGPGCQAIINGVPAFVGPSSLAASVGNLDFANIENPLRLDREEWLIDLCHTEWTINEIASGLPIQRLLPSIEQK